VPPTRRATHCRASKPRTLRPLTRFSARNFSRPQGFENWFHERSEAMKKGRYDDAVATELDSRYGISWLDQPKIGSDQNGRPGRGHQACGCRFRARALVDTALV